MIYGIVDIMMSSCCDIDLMTTPRVHVIIAPSHSHYALLGSFKAKRTRVPSDRLVDPQPRLWRYLKKLADRWT